MDAESLLDRPMPPHGLMGLVDSSQTAWWLIAIIGLVLLLAIAGIYWLIKRRQQSAVKLMPVLEPLAPRIQALEIPNSPREQAEFYYQLGMALRQAMERRYHRPFPDMTLREQLACLETIQTSGPIDRHYLQEFLKLAEAVKFQAKVLPTEDLKKHRQDVSDWIMALEVIDERRVG